MVVHFADLMRQDFFSAANASYKGPEFWPVVQRDEFATLLGAEHNMNKVLHVCVGHALLFLTAGLCRAYGALEY